MAVCFSVPVGRLKALRAGIRRVNAATIAANRAAKKHLYRRVRLQVAPAGELVAVQIRIADRSRVLWQHLTGVINNLGA